MGGGHISTRLPLQIIKLWNRWNKIEFNGFLCFRQERVVVKSVKSRYLYLIVDNPIESARRLNSDLDRMYQWAERWLVTCKFNAKKIGSPFYLKES